MERIVKILCVCAAIAFGVLEARVTEAEAEGPGGKAGAILREAGHVGNFLVDEAKMAWFRFRHRELPAGMPVFPHASEGLVSTAEQVCASDASACAHYLITKEGIPFDLGDLPQGSLQTLLGKPSCSLPQTQALAEQIADRGFPAQISDDPYAFKLNKAPGFQGGWLACEEANTARRQENNECFDSRSLKDFLAMARRISLTEHPRKKYWHDLQSTTPSESQELSAMGAIDWSQQTAPKFQGGDEAVLPRSFFPLNVEASASPCLEVASRLNAHDIGIDDMRALVLAERVG